jgi:DNA polymerase III delta subunit
MSSCVYALIGDDSFLQLQKLQEIAATLPRDAQRIDFDGETAELAAVFDELRSFAMFGGGKCVVVRNADAFITRFREQFEDYLAHPSNSATLLLRLAKLPSNQRVYKLIDKLGGIAKCEPPTPAQLPAWIQTRAKNPHHIALQPDAANLLADLIGADLGRLDNELAKLALRADDGQKVTAADVAGSVTFQREQEMWHLTDALASGNTTDALRRWRQLLQMDSSSEFRAVTWLTIWLENCRKGLAMKRDGENTFTIAKALRIWPADRAKGFMETAEALGDAGIARAVHLLAEVDRHSKSGIGEAATNVERFILTVGADQ